MAQTRLLLDLLRPDGGQNGNQHAIFMGVSGEGNVFYQYDADGNVAPGFPLNLSSGIEGFISVADIDGDGENEIITDFNLMEGGEGYIRAWEMDGTEITDGFPLRPIGLTYMNGANLGDIDGDGNLEIVTLSYVQNFSPDDPIYVTAYALNQPVENLVFGTYKGSNDRMGWIREEVTPVVSCNPVRDLDAEATSECLPDVFLSWDAPQAGSTGNLLGYQIWRDGILLYEMSPQWTYYSDEEVEFDSTYSYVIVAVYDDGCEAASEPLSVTALWDTVQENGLATSIYPNPAKDMLRVEGKGILQVEVFNIVGQKVLSIDEGFETIQLGQLPDGLYFMRLQSKQGEQTLKLIIER